MTSVSEGSVRGVNGSCSVKCMKVSQDSLQTDVSIVLSTPWTVSWEFWKTTCKQLRSSINACCILCLLSLSCDWVQACYGILKVPEGSWLCRTCALGVQPKCLLCPKKGGAMKPTRSGTKWVHVSCALWIPEVGADLLECPCSEKQILGEKNLSKTLSSLVCVLLQWWAYIYMVVLRKVVSKIFI